MSPAVPIQSAAARIYKVREENVVLDDAIAALFGVETRRLNEQVRRNAGRFEGYAFQLTPDEVANLMSQNATSSWGGRRKTPWAFTEHGVVMAATVLKSEPAIAAMKLVIETFVAARHQPTALTNGALLSQRSTGGLIPKLTEAIAAILDSVVDHHSRTTVRDEAQDLLSRSIEHLKDRLSRTGLENEALAARATKLLAEAEASKATAAKTQAEAGEIELRLLARKLQLVIEAERAMTGGDLDRFIGVLERLGAA
uniref:KilA-N DNA-binding domain-containing protein n=1 Tax=Caulobacter sp. (strain K31) TaxID=366602 RepID=B0T564_CAUSK